MSKPNCLRLEPGSVRMFLLNLNLNW